MALKRQNTSSPEPEEDDRPAKRRRPSWLVDSETFDDTSAREQPRIDISSGQQSAFPGLDEENDELIYDDPEDGLQYLRMVRSERKNVPHILAAERDAQPQPAENWNEYYDDQNLHPDRAWISIPETSVYEEEEHAPDAQDLYYSTVLERFEQLQTQLRIPPPLSTIELLTSSQPISFPADTAKAREKWRHVTKISDPNPTQLACMDPESVMELVKLLTESMSTVIKSRVKASVRRFSVWIWATLARCRDRGELSSEEISELRELGKRAVQLLAFARRSKIGEIGIWAEGEADDAVAGLHSDAHGEKESHPIEKQQKVVDRNEPDEVEEDDLVQLQQAKARMANMLEDTASNNAMQIKDEELCQTERSGARISIDQQICMVLDTAITIVGEVYGQRDLLEQRHIWE